MEVLLTIQPSHAI
nr:unnamed protein product [Callosobruchus chinensis]